MHQRPCLAVALSVGGPQHDHALGASPLPECPDVRPQAIELRLSSHMRMCVNTPVLTPISCTSRPTASTTSALHAKHSKCAWQAHTTLTVLTDI